MIICAYPIPPPPTLPAPWTHFHTQEHTHTQAFPRLLCCQHPPNEPWFVGQLGMRRMMMGIQLCDIRGADARGLPGKEGRVKGEDALHSVVCTPHIVGKTPGQVRAP